ncbi:MAG: ABC transporter substrate-binding protein [Streptosporangiales bacterium]
MLRRLLPRRLVAAGIAGLLVGSTLLVGAPASAAPKAATEAKKPSVLNIAMIEGIDSLNPFLAYFLDATNLMGMIYPSLMTFSAEDNSPVGDIAKSVKPSADKRTWTFKIRKGLEWTDGKPLTAKDAEFTLNLMMHNSAAATANGNAVKGFTSVTAPDDHTLVIKTEQPLVTVQTLSVPIVPEHIWSNVDDIAKYKNDDFPIVGYGPFILTDYQPDQFAKLKANPDFWRGSPKVDQVVLRTYKNTDAAVEALRKGEIDLVTKLNPNQYEALKGEDGISLNAADAPRFYEIGINPGAATRTGKPIGNGHPALKDRRVREALALAVDKDLIIKKVLQGYGTHADGLQATALGDWHWSPKGAEERHFDLKKANQILDKAGYKRGPDGTRRMPDGSRPLKFRLLGHSELPEDKQIASYLKSWYDDLGIKLDVQIVSKTRLNDLLGKGKYDLALGGWTSGPDPDFILSIESCGNRPKDNGLGGTTDNFTCVKGYDELLKKQRRTFDHEQRVQTVHEMQRMLYENAANIMIFYHQQLEAYRSDHFTNLTTQPKDNGVIWYQHGYWSVLSATPVAKQQASGGSSTGVIVGIVIVVVVVIGGIAVVAVRRRATAHDRE